MSFRDVELVRAIYDLLNRRDFTELWPLLDGSFVITQDPALPWGGWYEGHHGFATFGVAVGQHIDFQVKTLALFEANGEVIQYGRISGTVRATGATFDIPEVHRWTVRDGRAVLAHFVIDTPAMLRALSG